MTVAHDSNEEQAAVSRGQDELQRLWQAFVALKQAGSIRADSVAVQCSLVQRILGPFAEPVLAALEAEIPRKPALMSIADRMRRLAVRLRAEDPDAALDDVGELETWADELDQTLGLVIPVLTELGIATDSFGPFASAHEGAAVMLEEWEELWEAVRAGDVIQARAEATQVAAMALRFGMDVWPQEEGDDEG